MDYPNSILVLFCLCTGFVISNSQFVPEITRMHIRSDITYRFATTNVSSTLRNTARDFATEAEFIVMLPRAAFITYFEMYIDGVVYPGRVKEKQVAKKQYDRAKKKGQSAGKISQGVVQGTFKISVNVAADSEVHFNLTYQELLQRRFGVYQHVITIKPGQVVPDMQVDVYIRESREITVLKVPANLKEYGNALDSSENQLASVRRLGRSSAHISYSPTPAQQQQDGVEGISGHLVVEYDVQRDLDAGEIQVSDGYFVHFFAPTGLAPVKKTVLFILDVSGSMSGLRLTQVKEAMKVIIDDLRPDDKFALMTFSDNVEVNPHRGEQSRRLILATDDNKVMAKAMVEAFKTQGGTNINDALVSGLSYLEEHEEKKSHGDDTRTSMIIFLTDGQPTTGITSNPQIITNAKAANAYKFPIFSLAFGGGAELPFLAKLSLQNDGLARQIYLDSDPELQLQGFYSEISTPILNNIKIKYVGDSINEESLTDDTFHNYFDGSEIIVAGKLKDNSIDTLVTQVSGTGARGYMELDLDVDVQDEEEKIHQQSDVSQFTERLWAYLTIKKLLDKMVELDDPDAKEEAKAKALELSLKYSFVTPLTSMVVTKPEQKPEKPTDHPDTDASVRPTLQRLSASSMKSRRGPASHPGSFVDNDPHFIISVRGVAENVCFDIDGPPGTVYQLLSDSDTGITVNGKIVAPKEILPGAKKLRTYFGELAVLINNSLKLLIYPHKILINGQHYSWKHSSELNADGIRILMEEKRKVTVIVNENLVFSVLRHINKRKAPHKVDYLGFYIEEGTGLSLAAHGLIGQFTHQNATILSSNSTADSPSPSNSTVRLFLPGLSDFPSREVEVRLGHRRNMDLDAHVPCWFVRNNGRGLLHGHHTDYVVPRLSQKGAPQKRKPGAKLSVKVKGKPSGKASRKAGN